MPPLLNTIERLPLDSLVLYPGNPRRGDVAAIRESLRVNSQYEPIVVQASTRQVLAGNHRVLAARELGWTEIDAVVIDVDDEHALRILLSSNRTSDKGSYDTEDLLRALRQVAEVGLDGTGYSDSDMDDLLAQVKRLQEEPLLPAAVPPAPAFTPEEDVSEVVLLYGKAQRDQLEKWLRIIGKEKGTSGVSETVYAACELAARQLNLGDAPAA